MPSPAGARRALPLILLAALASALLAAAPARAAAGASAAPARPTALIAFLPGELNPPPGVKPPTVLERLDGHRELALGLLSATQSGYSPQQALLDLGTGTRTSRGTYHPNDPPNLTLLSLTGGGGRIVHWDAALRRAATAPADIVPGLLAGSIPGGAAYVGIAGADDTNLEAAAAAGRDGRIAAVSLGADYTVAARAQALLATHRLVVALLGPGAAGNRQLTLLLARRAPRELLIALEDPPPVQGPQLLATGIAGLGGTPGGLSSATTHVGGIAAGIDVLPTILRHLGVGVPAGVSGQSIAPSGARDAAALQRFDDRLGVIVSRRMPALQTFLFLWLVVVLLAGILRDRAGVLFGMRLGGLAMIWLPSMVLVSAAVQPSRQAELFLIAAGSFALALATDRRVPWPRGPALPAIAALVLYAVDLVNHSHLLIRSLLGPNPRSGSRFYGLGNELEIVLTILLLVAVAATLRRRERTRDGALAFALGGVALGVVAGSGRLGADVGAIFTIGAGAAVATLLMLPGGVTRRALAIALATPLAGLAALAALDLATGSNGHYVRNVLHGSSGDLMHTLQRRYELAWSILSSGTAPLVTILCVLAVAYAARHRERVYRTIRADPVWRACLGGGLAASIAGSLFNDSGPILLFIGIVALTFLTTYLRAAPIAPAQPPPLPPPPAADAEAPRVPQAATASGS